MQLTTDDNSLVNKSKLREKSELVQRVAAGDRQAEAEFYVEYRPLTQSILRRMTDDDALVEDLVQDTLLTVLLRLRDRKVDHPERIASYVIQTARFTLIGWFRRKDNQHRYAENSEEVEGINGAVEQSLIAGEQRAKLAEVLATLPVERDREILQRNYLLDEDKSTICREFNLPSQHFDRVISRARFRLKKVVQQQCADTRLALQAV